MDCELPKAHPVKSGIAAVAFFAFSAIGIVFGDIGTSPLYTFAAVFRDGPPTDERVLLGTMSTIFWTLTSIVLVKYILITLAADDNGEGGLVALYALICRATGIRSVADPHATDDSLEQFADASPPPGGFVAEAVRSFFGRGAFARTMLLFTVMIGSNLVLSDGILTPAISVVSAVEGIQFQTGMSAAAVTVVAVAILVVLFGAQTFGTHRVSMAFAPIMLAWFASLAAMGIYNAVAYDPTVFKALSPHYMYYFWSGRSAEAWRQLGSVMLCVTGAEALYADLGHFGRPGISLGFVGLVWPALTLAYLGQTAFLVARPEAHAAPFWSSTPDPVYWPVVVLATAAAVIASQAMITGAFSVAHQGMALNLFPRVAVRHTNEKVAGQIYVPAVNWLLFAGTIAVVVGFGSSANIGEAYGLAVIAVMFVDTALVAILMIVGWSWHPVFAAAFWLVFSTVTGAFLSSTALKIPHGAWFPMAVSAFLTFGTYAWFSGKKAKAVLSRSTASKLSDVVDGTPLLLTGTNTAVKRVPGIGVHYTETLGGVPHTLKMFLDRVPALHEVVVLLTNRRVPAPTVYEHERFVVRGLQVDGFYHVVARYGYTDVPAQGAEFLATVVAEVRAYVDAPRGGGDIESCDGPPSSAGSGASNPWVQQPSLPILAGDSSTSLPAPRPVRPKLPWRSMTFTESTRTPSERFPIPPFVVEYKSRGRNVLDEAEKRGLTAVVGKVKMIPLDGWGLGAALSHTYKVLEDHSETFGEAYRVGTDNLIEVNFYSPNV